MPTHWREPQPRRRRAPVPLPPISEHDAPPDMPRNWPHVILAILLLAAFLTVAGVLALAPGPLG